MNTRLLGVILFIGSLVITLNSFRSDDLDLLGTAARVIWSISCVFGILGLIQLNALGANTSTRAVGFLPMIGFISLILAGSLRLAGVSGLGDALNNTLATIGWVGIYAGMIVVGILTIAAKAWRGWRRFLPLLTVVMVPVAFGLGQAIGNPFFGGVLAFTPWLVLGYVIAAADPAPAIQQNILA